MPQLLGNCVTIHLWNYRGKTQIYKYKTFHFTGENGYFMVNFCQKCSVYSEMFYIRCVNTPQIVCFDVCWRIVFTLFRLSNCSIKENGLTNLVSALRLNPTHLRELYLSRNELGDCGLKLLADLLEDPCCKLEKLQ